MIRKYGKEPYRAAVVHGGPGAPGSVACIGRELSKTVGVIEPIQSRYSIAELIDELHGKLDSITKVPLTLIGHSWGAWLAVVFAAEHPTVVKQLVLVGSGPFEERYVPEIMMRRLARLSPGEAEEFRYLLGELDLCGDTNNDTVMTRLESFVEKSDNVDPIRIETDEIDLLPVDGKMYASVWPEAVELRRNGKLIERLKKLTCPVHVIHGDNDPHPLEGIVEPLRKARVEFTCHALKNCGHSPFRERKSREEFHQLLKEILQ